MSEGHTPGDCDPKPLTGEQVNLLQFENGQLRERVGTLRAKQNKRRGIVRRIEERHLKVNAAAKRLGYDPEKTDDHAGDWLAARVVELEREWVSRDEHSSLQASLVEQKRRVAKLEAENAEWQEECQRVAKRRDAYAHENDDLKNRIDRMRLMVKSDQSGEGESDA